jgi:dTDP-4-dehydrorhamnose 3,5-epimerase
MPDLKVTPTALPGVLLVEPRVFGDARGSFFESWNAKAFADAGIAGPFVQDNQSRSARGALRGLHFQVKRPQGKLVRVIAGAAFDVAVDIRRSSPGFGKWVGVELSADNRKTLWIPPGFAHGFLALSDGCEFFYKATDFYAPEHERAIRWDDPDLAIAWPLARLGGGAPLLSPKDAAAPGFAQAEVYE